MSARIFAQLATSSALTIAVVLGTVTATTGQVAKPRPAPKAKAAVAAPAPTTPIDLNTATAAEMEEFLPGVGEATARKIVAGRPYRTINDLAKAGVPPRTIEAIRPHVTVGPAMTKKAAVAIEKTQPKTATAPRAPGLVNLNTADVEALETLPGVGPAHARAIVASRPYDTVDDLARVKGLSKARIDALRTHVTTAAPAPPPTTVATTAKTATPPRNPATPKRSGTGTSTAVGKSTAKTAARPPLGKPVNINTADKAELDALPGIGPVKAQAIIDARPFKSIEDVKRVKGIKDFEFGKIRDMITVD